MCYRLQTLRHGDIRRSPHNLAMHLYCVARGGLNTLGTMFGGNFIESLQNSALALNNIGQPELALGYAHAATRLDVKAHKARYQAAVACLELDHPYAAFHYIASVRSQPAETLVLPLCGS